MSESLSQEFPFENGYGHFEDNGWSYRITNHRTPRPWTNVVSNGLAGFIVSQNGGGYSWRENAQLNRITRWEQDLIKDEWGKFLYIRDRESRSFWSAAWKPVCKEPEQYSVKHGIGYTTIESKNEGISSDWTMFVPRKDAIELWLVTLTNRSDRPRSLQLFTYFEWNLGAAPDWHREFHRTFIKTAYDASLKSIIATKRLWEVPSDKAHWNRNWEYVAFHSCSEQPASFDADKESFMGMYRSEVNPIAVEQGKTGEQSGDWLDAIASLNVNVELKPGESKTLVFAVGAGKNSAEVKKLIGQFVNVEHAQAALADVKEMWKEMLSRFQAKTPDAAMNTILNPWLQYQAIAGRLWGRTGYYQTGGAFGFRDQLQDSQIFLPIEPQRTADQLRLHARHQFKDGTVYHWWHPLSEVGHPTEMTDDLLWLPYILGIYLEETGDTALLKTKETFLDDKKPATMYDHSCRAIDKVLTRMSKRGIPFIGAGDWNDGLSAVGLKWKGESIWLGQFLHRILLDFIVIAKMMKDNARVKKYTAVAAKLKKDLNKNGWDGKYYYGATKDNGEKIGSSKNTEGKVWLNTQTWAVLGDVADAKRAEQVFDVVENDLEGKNGTLLVKPAYATPDSDVGYLTRYAAGMRENGGVYTHAATWSVLAAAKLGRSEAAFRLFSKINPIRLCENPKEYIAEPYVTPGNIEGPDSRFYGKGGWTWYSGSAAWLFKGGVEGILGVKASHHGLVVEPCIPASWKHYSVQRLFRGATYRISVENPEGVDNGVAALTINGKDIPLAGVSRSVTLPVAKKGTTVDVKIVMGT
jgi:cellobiose phosphorylase